MEYEAVYLVLGSHFAAPFFLKVMNQSSFFLTHLHPLPLPSALHRTPTTTRGCSAKGTTKSQVPPPPTPSSPYLDRRPIAVAPLPINQPARRRSATSGSGQQVTG